MIHSNDEYKKLRLKMVDHQLRHGGIVDERVLTAMSRVPRHSFVTAEMRRRAYEDHPLPIGAGQTISQPFMVARMSELLELTGNEKVLEIGTGCGYQTAVLAEMTDRVFSMERLKELAWPAEKLLTELGYHNALVRVADGSHGWKEEAPFDAIIVTAGSPNIPKPLTDQLAEKGRLVIPVGDEYTQTLHRVRKRFGKLHTEQHERCRFVPLVGRYGWEVE